MPARTKEQGVLVALLVLASASGCRVSNVVGPLSHERDERNQLHKRATAAGTSVDVLDKVFLPLTPEEELLARHEDASCRRSYMWKNGLTWIGSVLVGVGAGITIGTAYDTSGSNANDRLTLGVSAGTMAAVGAVLVATGGIMEQRFTDRGCTNQAR